MKCPTATVFILLHPQTHITLVPQLIMAESMADSERYQRLINTTDTSDTQSTAKEELRNVPLVWWHVGEQRRGSGLPQVAVMGHVPDGSSGKPVLLNTNSPWSAFLYGSQGSGNLYTLFCMLENCLLKNDDLGMNLMRLQA
jgi:hypothetical protein